MGTKGFFLEEIVHLTICMYCDILCIPKIQMILYWPFGKIIFVWLVYMCTRIQAGMGFSSQ